ncbi:MAG: hypothetical protein LUE17_13830 [Planctomycetaceae bacterium]|nr:hypothetical protein [Planctomycetaceae bacterium]
MQFESPIAAQLAERIEDVVNSIASGDNACGTLRAPDGGLNRGFLRACVRPTLEVYEEEADQHRRDKRELSAISEERRQVLELIYANASGGLPAAVNERLCRALGFRYCVN